MLSAQPVPKALQGIVDGFWSFQGDDRLHRILPDGCLDFLFDLASGDALVVGAMSCAQVIRMPAGWNDFGARRARRLSPRAPNSAAQNVNQRCHARRKRRIQSNQLERIAAQDAANVAAVAVHAQKQARGVFAKFRVHDH